MERWNLKMVLEATDKMFANIIRDHTLSGRALTGTYVDVVMSMSTRSTIVVELFSTWSRVREIIPQLSLSTDRPWGEWMDEGMKQAGFDFAKYRR